MKIKNSLLVVVIGLFSIKGYTQQKIKSTDFERALKILVIANHRYIHDSIFFNAFIYNHQLKISELKTTGFDKEFKFYSFKIDTLVVKVYQDDSITKYRVFFDKIIPEYRDSFIICLNGLEIYQLAGFRKNDIDLLTNKIRNYYGVLYFNSSKKFNFRRFKSRYSIPGFDLYHFKKYW